MIKTTDVRQHWQMFPKALSENIVNQIISIANGGVTQQATTFVNDGSTHVPADDIRKSRVSWIKDKRVLNLLYEYADMANRNAFNVHIFNKTDIQYTEYLASENGHYSKHHDIDWNRNDGYDRKLSITVQLSNPNEYEGGDFMFCNIISPDKTLKEKGTILVFPSYLEHLVTPVTKGIRKSLVAWFEGPKWQ